MRWYISLTQTLNYADKNLKESPYLTGLSTTAFDLSFELSMRLAFIITAFLGFAERSYEFVV